MNFQVWFSNAAAKRYPRLDAPLQSRIAERIEQLRQNPFDPRISKWLQNDPTDRRSSRVGDWRILFTVDVAGRRIEIESIAPRGEAYKNM